MDSFGVAGYGGGWSVVGVWRVVGCAGDIIITLTLRCELRVALCTSAWVRTTAVQQNQEYKNCFPSCKTRSSRSSSAPAPHSGSHRFIKKTYTQTSDFFLIPKTATTNKKPAHHHILAIKSVPKQQTFKKIYVKVPSK